MHKPVLSRILMVLKAFFLLNNFRWGPKKKMENMTTAFNISISSKISGTGYTISVYHIWEHEIVMGLFPPVDKKELLETMGKHVRVCMFQRIKRVK